MTDKAQDATSAEAPTTGAVRRPRRAYKADATPDRFILPERAEDIAPDVAAGFDQVVAVRRALYQALPVTVGGHVVEFDHRATYGEIVQRMRTEGGGLWCAGSAFVFQRALEALGYKAWTLHFGFDDDLTHAVVVVQVGERLLVQDVYLNEGYSIDIRELLPRLQQGSEAPVHRETRDRKVHLIPRDHEDRADLDWYERNSELELPPLGTFRCFVLVPYAHRQRVMRSWTGRNAERLRRLALPQDDLFLLLNPIGVFDGEHFESAVQRMPIVRDWIAEGGRTLAQQLQALESDANAHPDEASRDTLRSLINQITALRGQSDALQGELKKARESAAEEQAKFVAQGARLAEEVQRLVAAGAEAGARQAAEAEALLSQAAAERARRAAEIAALTGERDHAAAKLTEIETDREHLIRALEEFERLARSEVQAAEAGRKEAMNRKLKLERRNAELESTFSMIAAELAGLDHTPPDKGVAPERLALRSARRLVGETYSQATRVRTLERKVEDLIKERGEMMGEINHLSSVANNSRHLRVRRWLARLVKRE